MPQVKGKPHLNSVCFLEFGYTFQKVDEDRCHNDAKCRFRGVLGKRIKSEEGEKHWRTVRYTCVNDAQAPMTLCTSNSRVEIEGIYNHEQKTSANVQATIGGTCGVVVALLFETVLFIARTSGKRGMGVKYLRYLDPKKFEDQQKPNEIDVQFEFQTVPSARGVLNSETKKAR